MALTVGVVLSGCGFKDGSEIHESVLTLLALDRAGAEARCFAPDVAQAQVVNHLTGKPVKQKRNVLQESARIARGRIEDVALADPSTLDALVLPGGFGAAQNLCTFAADGARATVDPGVARLVRAMHAARKPIAGICIAPALLALVLGSEHVALTIGDDAGTARVLESLGATHLVCPVQSYAVDEAHRLVTTPAYMLGPSIRHVAQGIERAIDALLQLAREPQAV